MAYQYSCVSIEMETTRRPKKTHIFKVFQGLKNFRLNRVIAAYQPDVPQRCGDSKIFINAIVKLDGIFVWGEEILVFVGFNHYAATLCFE